MSHSGEAMGSYVDPRAMYPLMQSYFRSVWAQPSRKILFCPTSASVLRACRAPSPTARPSGNSGSDECSQSSRSILFQISAASVPAASRERQFGLAGLPPAKPLTIFMVYLDLNISHCLWFICSQSLWSQSLWLIDSERKTHGRSRRPGSGAGGCPRRCPSRAPCLRARRARFSGLYMGGDAPGPADAQLWGLVALAKVCRRRRRCLRRRRRAAA